MSLLSFPADPGDVGPPGAGIKNCCRAFDTRARTGPGEAGEFLVTLRSPNEIYRSSAEPMCHIKKTNK